MKIRNKDIVNHPKIQKIFLIFVGVEFGGVWRIN